MKYRSRQPKPETGMEITVTLSMSTDQSVERSADSLIKFMEGVTRLSAETGSVWVKIHCAGIPEEFKERLEAALAPKRPNLKSVINNQQLKQEG